MPDTAQLIEAGGLVIIALMVFAESGIMVGLLFPGDTLLLTAGIIAAAGNLPLVPTIAVIALAAMAGDNTGYWIGRRFGERLFQRAGHLFHRRMHFRRAQRFFRRYGSKTMLVAHFIPYVRSFVPLTAGIGRMQVKAFIIFDAIGDWAWAITLTLCGYIVGRHIPNVEQYVDPLITIVTLSFIPALFYRIIGPKLLRAVRARVRHPLFH